MTDDNDFKLKNQIIIDLVFYKEQYNKLLEENKVLNQRLKIYTCSKSKKYYYERNKEKIIKRNNEYKKNRNNKTIY